MHTSLGCVSYISTHSKFEQQVLQLPVYSCGISTFFLVILHLTIRMMTTNTNISSISVDMTVLMMIMVDTGAGWGSRVGAGSLVVLSTDDIAVLMMIMVDTGAGWGSRVGAGSLVVLSTGVVEGLQYKKKLTFISNAASV